MNFTVLERPQCVIVREDIGFVHTVVIHTHTVEVYTDFIGGSDCRVMQDGVEYEKYRHFSNWMRFQEAMPGTAGAIRPISKNVRTFSKTLCPHCTSLTTFELGNGVYSCVECGFKVREEYFIPMQVR